MDKAYYAGLKGTEARDCRLLVFSTNPPHIVHEFKPDKVFEFCFEFTEIFVFKSCSGGLIPRRLRYVGYQALQYIVLRGIRPCSTSVCHKMYTTLLLFCGVWNAARHSSARSDTPQDLVLWGLIPHRLLFCRESDPVGKSRPHGGIRQKSFESLPFSLRDTFQKSSTCMNHTS